MDNVTHALAGLLLADVAVASRPGRASAGFRRAAAIAGVVTAELPDVDVLYAGRLTGFPTLGSLLHHRGHTHTVPLALLGALLVWGVTVWLARDARAPADRYRLLALCAVGALSHLALDWTNSYGVHPFWPADDRWFYGDAVFIVEPWLWVAAIPPLLFVARAWGTRVLLGVLLAGIVAAAWMVGMVARDAALALTAGAVLWLAAARVAPAAWRTALGIGAWLAVELTFAATAAGARSAVRAASAASGATVRDVVLNPGPGDPRCWNALVVEADVATYRVLGATVAAFGRDLDACGPRPGTLPPTARPGTARVRWEGEWSAPRAELAALARGNCVVAAMLGFVRVPMWVRQPGLVRLWDVRYGRRGFASIDAPEPATRCPTQVPPWVPPRADLLGN